MWDFKRTSMVPTVLGSGDNLPHYLFILVMEFFSWVCQQHIDSGNFSYHPKGKDLGINHMFAND